VPKDVFWASFRKKNGISGAYPRDGRAANATDPHYVESIVAKLDCLGGSAVTVAVNSADARYVGEREVLARRT